MVQKKIFKTKDYSNVKFTYSSENAETVEVFGLNGDWQSPVAMKRKKDGTFSVEVSLAKNTKHQFKYRINGTQWINEPEADGLTPDTFGGQNSVVFL